MNFRQRNHTSQTFDSGSGDGGASSTLPDPKR